MGRLIFGMMQSLDGYIAGRSGGPQPDGLFRHRQQQNSHHRVRSSLAISTICFRGSEGLLYGRRIYEVMRYWDADQPDWDEIEHDFARAWRSKPKWVASRSLTSVGPNATLVQGDLIQLCRKPQVRTRGRHRRRWRRACERALRCRSG